MPALYAHQLFGESSLENFSDGVKAVIEKDRPAFDIGLQGPDILFFTDFGANKQAFSLANKMHSHACRFSLSYFISVLQKSFLEQSEYHNTILSYIYGFIGHFCLDTAAHNYVNKVTKTSFDHNSLESEFDKFLIKSQNKNPFNLRQEKFIRGDEKTNKAIELLYSSFEETAGSSAVKGIVDYCKIKIILRQLQRFIPFLIEPIFKAVGAKNTAGGMEFTIRTQKKFIPNVLELKRIFDESLTIYPELIKNFNEVIEDNYNIDKLSEYFDRHFLGAKK